MNDIKHNLKVVQENIGKALQQKRNKKLPTLVAVSKSKSLAAIQEAYDNNQRHFGETNVQELLEKAAALPPDISWHFIGHLETNKCITLCQIPNLYMIETIDGIKKATAVNNACESLGRAEPLKVLIEVNTTGEFSKIGISPEECLSVAKHIIKNCPKLKFCGLMTIGMSNRPNDEEYSDFKALLGCCLDVEQYLNVTGIELSMGMTSDYELAIAKGSTNVRIGTAIFGPRN
ncbi:hypothetical protein LY90DRAFT_377446 [Neocallimastix californiae]|jgi:hypothetical protein|uniref:Pyridoxal phosphate homeostasis protein n=1 Tax=Neocallimastix californiae TaxID=1754190 RepID=A0A1Y2EY02_9FUNG|nr:hypothetical protein LY90DRAFT_377446 [Neocallimastix californiae]|eukprot:ORY76479.1 hypothetical protein LY90DRAFT_377446 [Neocallimastix californiae]